MRDFDYLEYKGPAKLEDFKNKLMGAVRESADELSDATLCEILLGKIEGKDPTLDPVCAAWRRMEEDDPNSNLEWLVKAINMAVEISKSQKNQKDRQDCFAGNNVRRGGDQMQISDADKGDGGKGGGKKNNKGPKTNDTNKRVPPMAELRPRGKKVKAKRVEMAKAMAKAVVEVGVPVILG